MADPYAWFDPHQVRYDAEYWEDKARYERYDLERYLEGCKGENRAMKAHIEHLSQLISRLVPSPFPSQPLFVSAHSLGQSELGRQAPKQKATNHDRDDVRACLQSSCC